MRPNATRDWPGRGAGLSREWNGIRYKRGMSSKNVGSRQLSMNVAFVPPGAVAFAHIHVDFEEMLHPRRTCATRIRSRPAPHSRSSGRRLHLHRAGRAARGAEPQRHRAGRQSSRAPAPTNGTTSSIIRAPVGQPFRAVEKMILILCTFWPWAHSPPSPGPPTATGSLPRP